MAIKLPNPGLGDGQTGDNEYVMWTKVKDNFNNQTHAASRLVGTGLGNVLEVGTYGIGYKSEAVGDLNVLLKSGFYDTQLQATGSPRPGSSGVVLTVQGGRTGSSFQFWGLSNATAYADLYIRHYKGSEWTEWARVYTSLNTTKEAGTGYLVASSPVLKVQHDSFEKVHEAEQLDIEVKNIKTGVYEITGTTGLREDDGWNLKPPKDVNGNVLCICEASEKDGVITLKTYAKRFDFETVSIVADYDKPLDIPEGATVMLRFNDLPQEELDEPIE